MCVNLNLHETGETINKVNNTRMLDLDFDVSLTIKPKNKLTHKCEPSKKTVKPFS